MPTQSLFTSVTGLYLVRTLWHGAAQTIYAPPPPSYRWHGTAQAVYPPRPPSRSALC